MSVSETTRLHYESAGIGARTEAQPYAHGGQPKSRNTQNLRNLVN